MKALMCFLWVVLFTVAMLSCSYDFVALKPRAAALTDIVILFLIAPIGFFGLLLITGKGSDETQGPSKFS